MLPPFSILHEVTPLRPRTLRDISIQSFTYRRAASAPPLTSTQIIASFRIMHAAKVFLLLLVPIKQFVFGHVKYIPSFLLL